MKRAQGFKTIYSNIFHFFSDCDFDSDCDFGLICFDRDLGVETVPGCIGNPTFIGNGDDDFCILPPTPDTLVITGDEAVPPSAFPMGKCQGGKYLSTATATTS